LTSLRGSVEVALLGEMNESECRRVLDLVLQESHRTAEALETLRDLLEIEGSSEEAQPVSWTKSVEKSLEEAASADKIHCPQLVRNVMDEVWVRAGPEQLDAATRRFIGGVIKARRERQVVRIGLSAHGETACLSIYTEALPPDAEPSPQRGRKYLAPETRGSGEIDWWIARRAIERQGGSLKINDVSETCRCYQLYLPLADRQNSGNAQSS
jgi:hypothetical protein